MRKRKRSTLFQKGFDPKQRYRRGFANVMTGRYWEGESKRHSEVQPTKGKGLKNELQKSAGGKGRWKKSIEFGGEVINYDLLSPSRIVLYRVERIKWRGTSDREYIVNVYRSLEKGLDLVSHKTGLTKKQASKEIEKAVWSINSGIGDIIGY
jgi:hypothetical protein